MKQFRLDNYTSAVLGRRYQGLKIKTVSAHFLYAQGGVFARIVDKPADDAVSGSVAIDNDDGAIQSELERLNVFPLLADAVRWSRISGGACLIPIVQDGQALDMPLDINRIGIIEELRVYDAEEMTPYGNPYNDPAKANYGQPMMYQVSTNSGSFVVHESRVIPIAGAPIPNKQKTHGVPFRGRSEVERPYQAVVQWIEAIGKIYAMLERKQQPVYGMKGLAEAVANGFESQIQTRIDNVDLVRGILNTVAIDSEDQYSIIDLNVSGVSEALNEFKELMAAETGMPITLLFGRSAAGMNATGEGDLRGYYDMVDAIRSKQAQPALERIIAMIAAQQGINAVADWRINWPPLLEPTAKEKAEIEKIENDALVAEMNALTQAVQMGAVSEAQAMEYLQQKRLFGLGSNNDNRQSAVQYLQELT